MENPALSSPNGEPVPMAGEFFVLSRHGISFSAKSGSWKGEGRGNLYLSTLRIVFVVRTTGRLPQTVEDATLTPWPPCRRPSVEVAASRLTCRSGRCTTSGSTSPSSAPTT